jgi:DNA-binding MarR family transcriptional regulator
MPPRPRPRPAEGAATVLARVAPLVSRWVERLLAEQSPPLTLAQYLALEDLAAGGTRATELAAGAGVSRSAVSQLVASLEELDLVERMSGSADRRRQELELSAEGKRVLSSARRSLRGRLDPLLADLPRPEADALARSLVRVEAVLRGTAPPRRPPRPPRPRPRR